MIHRTARFAMLLLVGALPATAMAQKPAVTPADYGKFENLGMAAVSPDGRWLAYPITRVDESREIRVRGLRRDTTLVLAHATGPVFTADSRWLLYTIGPSPAERERLERDNKPVHNRAGILDLQNLAQVEVERVAAFSVSPDGKYVALRGYPPEGRNTDAVDLLVRELATGRTTPFGNVTSHAWSDVGALLALTVVTESGAGNGVQLFDAASATVRVLDSSPVRYRALSWRDDADDLAVLRAAPDSGYRDTTHVVLAWRGLRREARASTFDPTTATNFPREMRIAETRTPAWSDDGTFISFGIRPRRRVQPKDTAAADSIRMSDVQVWHSQDYRIFPMQRVQEQQDLRRTLLSVWHLNDNRFVQVGTDLFENATLLENGRYATETSVENYRFDSMFGRDFRDVFLVDLRTGDRRMVIEKVRHNYGGSATGRYIAFFKGEDFHVYDTQTGETRNLTQNVDADFRNTDYDYPVTQLPPWGVAGWTEGDRALLVYDEYDIWSLAPDGSGGRKLTDGAKDSTVHRYVALDRQADAIDLSQPIYLSLTGKWTKKSGYARLRPNRGVERLIYEDRAVSRLARADSADVFLFTTERYDDSPDYYVAGPTLADARQVTNTNPFQSDYAWGRSELIEYTSQSGRRLQGALMYPAGYQPGRRYPMIVYQYERLSQGVHRYVVPSRRSYYNVSVFTSQGYFVLQPDIVYTPREPGVSAVEAIVPAVQAVIDKGLVDPARVGLVGHSWGGYQATYVPTRTNIFAASVAGAPITNYLSFMGAIHWNGGLPETGHWETGQARMDVPYWEDFDAHVRNSPAAFVHELKTPMLMMFGDSDGTVDWHQGVEFYNFARRAGNPNFVMLVYPGEDHGLRKKENQIDYQRRILEWFGHWLKGEPAPKWMKEGVTFLERKSALENGGGARR